MRIKSRLLNRMIDKADAAFTWSSKILPPPKPTGLRIYGYNVLWTDVGVVVLTILLGLGAWWYYGHSVMFVVTLLIMAMLWMWVM